MTDTDEVICKLKETNEKLVNECKRLSRTHEVLYKIIRIYIGGTEDSVEKNVEIYELCNRLDELTALVNAMKTP